MARILIVEDDRETTYILKHILKQTGHQLEHAENGKEGLALALATQPTLAIVDLRLPEVDGLTLIQEIRSYPELREMRIIVLTCDDTAETQQRVEELGGDLFLAKPFFYNDLLENVDRVLEKTKVSR